MSRVISKVAISIPEAVRRLRRRLSELKGESVSQNEMARRIGLGSVDTYRQWEQGRRIPSGEWLQRLMQLAPDRASLEAFGIVIPPEPPKTVGKRSPEDAGATGAGEIGALLASRLGLDLQHSVRQRRDRSSSTSQLPSFGRSTRKTRRSRRK
jgi:transcriptional regulator with XRE-family HTH domain